MIRKDCPVVCFLITLRAVSTLVEEIIAFLKSNGFESELLVRMGQEVISVRCGYAGSAAVRCVVPLPVYADSPSVAQAQSGHLSIVLKSLETDDLETVVITEDRWRLQNDMMKERLLAHLEVFTSLYARNCEVRKIDKDTAAEFLDKNHSYGDATCRYRYGLYLKRYTGKRGVGSVEPGTLVAVATFSNARKWQKGDKVIRSYEWTRYASLPGARISGGMGKVLKAFIKDVQPDDIMSYADLEWSEGKVYEQLGFVLEGKKEPVMFVVDGEWGRFPVKPGMTEGVKPGMTEGVKPGMTCERFFMNLGSNKYRLKLTQYE